ncbi:hypothetical protein HDV00_004695 [Rhizophlyctis rosea]|nr:hypothetical protein HDV00_004695 [Rhizophlyctis rosea]
MFRGRVPTNARESYRCWDLMMGGSPMHSVPEGGKRRSKKGSGREGYGLAVAGGTGLAPTSPVVVMFGERYCRPGGRRVWTEGDVEGLLEALGTKGSYREGVSDGVLIPETVRRRRATPLQKHWAKGHTLTPLQLFTTLRTSLHNEMPKIRFDYISFHTRCWGVLHSINTNSDLREMLINTFGEKYLLRNSETYLFSVVGRILMMGERSLKAAERAGLVKTYGEEGVQSLALLRACEVLEKFVEREGGVECGKVGA